MFLNHFQFTTQPFAERVSAAALWQDDRMQQGLARLRYLAEQATGLLKLLVGKLRELPGRGKERLFEQILHKARQAEGSLWVVFDEAAKGLIHDYSGGVPRQIDNLATACLLQAAAQNASRVNEAILQQTFSEFQLP